MIERDDRRRPYHKKVLEIDNQRMYWYEARGRAAHFFYHPTQASQFRSKPRPPIIYHSRPKRIAYAGYAHSSIPANSSVFGQSITPPCLAPAFGPLEQCVSVVKSYETAEATSTAAPTRQALHRALHRVHYRVPFPPRAVQLTTY